MTRSSQETPVIGRTTALSSQRSAPSCATRTSRGATSKPILKKASLDPGTRPYDLRHTFATLWMESGEDEGNSSSASSGTAAMRPP